MAQTDRPVRRWEDTAAHRQIVLQVLRYARSIIAEEHIAVTDLLVGDVLAALRATAPEEWVSPRQRTALFGIRGRSQ